MRTDKLLELELVSPNIAPALPLQVAEKVQQAK
jgi:hypothetical protein